MKVPVTKAMIVKSSNNESDDSETSNNESDDSRHCRFVSFFYSFSAPKIVFSMEIVFFFSCMLFFVVVIQHLLTKMSHFRGNNSKCRFYCYYVHTLYSSRNRIVPKNSLSNFWNEKKHPICRPPK